MRDALAAGLAAAALALAVVALGVGIDGGANAPRASTVPAEQGSGRALFARMGCGSCHTLATAGSTCGMGPDLDSATEAELVSISARLIAQITSPAGDGGLGAMPTDFGSRMSSRELDSLVDFLLAQR